MSGASARNVEVGGVVGLRAAVLWVGLKGVSGLGEPRRRKDRRPEAESRSEPRESSTSGAFGRLAD